MKIKVNKIKCLKCGDTVMPSDVDSAAKYSPEQIVERAKSRLGEDEFRNSESFVRWCRSGC